MVTKPDANFEHVLITISLCTSSIHRLCNIVRKTLLKVVILSLRNEWYSHRLHKRTVYKKKPEINLTCCKAFFNSYLKNIILADKSVSLSAIRGASSLTAPSSGDPNGLSSGLSSLSMTSSAPMKANSSIGGLTLEQKLRFNCDLYAKMIMKILLSKFKVLWKTLSLNKNFLWHLKNWNSFWDFNHMAMVIRTHFFENP